MYCEGSDQHRGWFNKSLVIGVSTKGESPFRQLVSHGFVLDSEGRAMSKSVGNVIAPQQVIKEVGADVLRLFVSSTDYSEDVRIGQEILKRVTDAYRRLRNTFRFLLGNLYDFDPAKDAVAKDDMLEIDRWIMHRLQEVTTEVNSAYERNEFHKVYHTTHNFAAVDLSALYLDIIKDRLYASAPNELKRRSAQTALYEILSVMVRLLAPVLVHTADEVWKFSPGSDKAESVHLETFPTAKQGYLDSDLAARWQRIFELRNEVYQAIEQARQSGVIGKPLESRVTIKAPGELHDFLQPYVDELPAVLIVSQVQLERAADGQELSIEVRPPVGEKCQRCWLISETVGANKEHEMLCSRCTEAVL
jgi:isoleucyl-tRNA synthetase